MIVFKWLFFICTYFFIGVGCCISFIIVDSFIFKEKFEINELAILIIFTWPFLFPILLLIIISNYIESGLKIIANEIWKLSNAQNTINASKILSGQKTYVNSEFVKGTISNYDGQDTNGK